MLKLIIGPAGTGKTGKIYREIQDAVESRQGGRVLIVPEQFSHEAERELCRICGDALSRYAEVLSFTGLARAVESELGGGALPVLDKGGKLLCMSLAVSRCRTALKVFSGSAMRPEMQSVLLSVLDAMRTSCVTSEMLLEAAETIGGDLKLKLMDLAVISEAYRQVLGNSRIDPADALTTLAARLSESRRIDEHSVIYVDGFTDFTMLELEVLQELLRKHVTLNVCLTLDGISGSGELFTLPRRSAMTLQRMAEAMGEPFEAETIQTDSSSRAVTPPVFLAENLFSDIEPIMDASGAVPVDASGAVSLIQAADMAEECRAAAAEILELIREKGYRRRDIAIAVRNFEEYAPVLENTFEEYGIPLFTARRTSMAVRPLPLMLSCAYEILNTGWKPDDLITYLGTGLSGLTAEECDTLSEYIFRWDLNSGAWHRSEPWKQHPEGYGKEETESSRLRLEEINRLRDRLASPLLALEQSSGKADTASAQAAALYEFLVQVDVPALLDIRAERLSAMGRNTEAEEYSQIWNITVTSLEQVHGILGDLPMDREKFSTLFLHMLSSYDIGSIPVSLDNVTAGDFDRMRRRNLRCLFVLGASADRIPAFISRSRLFSDDELMRLEEVGACIGDDPDNGMWREYALLYNCLSLPSERLWVSCSLAGSDGSPLKPSLVMDRAEKLFGLSIQPCDSEKYRTAARIPALRAAVSGRDRTARALNFCMESLSPGAVSGIRKAAALSRGQLSHGSVEKLYGKSLGITASRAEKFFSCPYAYFTGYGLKVRPYKKAVFESSDIGTFTHYVLEHVIKEISDSGSFRDVTDEQVREISEKYIREYETTLIRDFSEKSCRFLYLFHRAEQDIFLIVLDTVRELSRSDFRPVEFEFDISQLTVRMPLPASVSGHIRLRGSVDRIDVWVSNGESYIRVGDYKTGGKDFSLSDLWYGMSMQMVLYLYALCSGGAQTAALLQLPEGTRLHPAGVEYIPAFSKYISEDSQPEDEKIIADHRKKLRRSGIVLTEGGVPEAWERDSGTDYTPVKYDKNGFPTGDSAVTEEQLRLLCGHMTHRLGDMASELSSGVIDARPVRKISGKLPCEYCDMRRECSFVEGENGEECRDMPKLSAEDVWENIKREAEKDGSI